MTNNQRAGTPRISRQQLTRVDGLAQLAFLVQGTLQRLAADQGVSIIQTRLLGILRDREPSMTELASLLGLDKSSTTGLVDRAERRGLVTRSLSTEDRRSMLVRLTKKGRALASAVSNDFESEISTMLGLLPPRDRGTLSRLVSRLVVDYAAERGVDLFANLQTL